MGRQPPKTAIWGNQTDSAQKNLPEGFERNRDITTSENGPDASYYPAFFARNVASTLQTKHPLAKQAINAPNHGTPSSNRLPSMS